MLKKIFSLVFLFLFSCNFLVSQNDTNQLKGTIKVNKLKEEKIYITSFAKYRYELSDKEASRISNNFVFQPFPVVDGHAFPFNYSKYFNDKFKSEKIILKGKSSDTVSIEVRITKKGKVYLNNKTADKNASLNFVCLDFLKQIKDWQPAYAIVPEKGVLKNQIVIEPKKINISSVGTITIIFSLESFDN